MTYVPKQQKILKDYVKVLKKKEKDINIKIHLFIVLFLRVGSKVVIFSVEMVIKVVLYPLFLFIHLLINYYYCFLDL
jgi:hypothetical protein